MELTVTDLFRIIDIASTKDVKEDSLVYRTYLLQIDGVWSIQTCIATMDEIKTWRGLTYILLIQTDKHWSLSDLTDIIKNHS